MWSVSVSVADAPLAGICPWASQAASHSARANIKMASAVRMLIHLVLLLANKPTSSSSPLLESGRPQHNMPQTGPQTSVFLNVSRARFAAMWVCWLVPFLDIVTRKKK
jgi:hypothetical protein